MVPFSFRTKKQFSVNYPDPTDPRTLKTSGVLWIEGDSPSKSHKSESLAEHCTRSYTCFGVAARYTGQPIASQLLLEHMHEARFVITILQN